MHLVAKQGKFWFQDLSGDEKTFINNLTLCVSIVSIRLTLLISCPLIWNYETIVSPRVLQRPARSQNGS
jgi:hypothetical protein